MNEITHCHNQRPIYRKNDKNIFEWKNPKKVMGEKQDNYYYNYHPFVIDIETSAELGQRPILLVGYDSLEKTLIILYTVDYQGYELYKGKAKKLIENAGDIDYNRIIVDNLSITKFEEYVLKKIHNWNKKADERNDSNRKSLVAHNASFDIPMMGTPNDELLDKPKVSGEYEMSVSYKDYCMLAHRAGAFGHIYSFRSYRNGFEMLNIPVGDTQVGAKSLWIGETSSLVNVAKDLDVDIEVSESEEHGNLNNEYVKYCINDVIATYKIYNKMQGRVYDMFGNLPLERIYSTASIGKYVLREMDYKRVGYTQNAVDRIVPAYFGGRTDAYITGEIVENLRYTDILSQYPTVSKLTNVWEYMQCQTVDIQEIDKDNLPDIKPKELKNPKKWKEISEYYVKIEANNDTLPVRTRYFDDSTKVITAKVTTEKDLMYHYMDVISSKLIDQNNNIEIKNAWKVTKKGEQNLSKTEIAGVKLKPKDNVMAKSIESRKEIQKEKGKNSQTKN